MELSDLLPHLGLGRRRHLPHPLDAHGGVQPPPRPTPDEHRQHDVRPAQYGKLAHVRPRQRREEPTGLRRTRTPVAGTSGGTSNWGSGFLPSTFAGVLFRSQGEAVLNLNNPPGLSDAMQSATIEAVRDLNGIRHASVGDPEINSRDFGVRAGRADANGRAGTRSTCRRKTRKHWMNTASTGRSPTSRRPAAAGRGSSGSSRPTASSRGGSWSAGSVSCR